MDIWDWHRINLKRSFHFNNTNNSYRVSCRIESLNKVLNQVKFIAPHHPITYWLIEPQCLSCLTQNVPWWRHQMETFSALLAICAGNSPVPGEFHAQRPVTRSFDVFIDLRLNKRLSKQSWGWWFETPSCPLWRHSNALGWLWLTSL